MRIASIIAVNNLPVRKNRKLLSNTVNLHPNDEIGVYAEVRNGSLIFNVTLNISDFPIKDINEHAVILNGRLESSGEILFSSEKFNFSKKGELSFSVVINKTPDGFLFLNEIIIWEILMPDSEMRLEPESTKLSLYFLPKLPLDASKGMAIEALYLTNQALSKSENDKCSINDNFISRAGYSDPLSDIAYIANWMFFRPRKAIYDTDQGAPHFTSFKAAPWQNNIVLNYTGIFNATEDQICNCYDMAAFLQYQVQYSVGVFVYFDYIAPFGYLKETNLIGWGSCNNPFFKRNSSNKIVAENSSSRTSFGNHAFIYLPDYGVVADTCAGPHIGTESKQQYLSNGVDTITPIPPHVQPGTVNDITDYQGVIDVTTSLKTSVVMNQSNLLAFVESVNLKSSILKKELLIFKNNLDIRECEQVGEDWKFFEDELHSDFPFVIRQILLSDGSSKSIDFKIYVAGNSTETALNQYLSLGSYHQMSSPIFEKGPENLGESSGKFEAAGYSRYIWLLQNIVFDLRATNFSTDIVEKILSWISKNVSQKTELLNENSFPSINEIRLSNKSVKVGDNIVIEIDCSSELTLFIEGSHPGLYIQTEQADSFSFLAKESSINNLQICAVNPTSLVSLKKDITIVVE